MPLRQSARVIASNSGPRLHTKIRISAALMRRGSRLSGSIKLSFEPDCQRADLPSASKIFDKAVSEIKPYFDADVHFDRTQTDRDLSPALKEAPLDLQAFVENRLKAEMGRIAHRR